MANSFLSREQLQKNEQKFPLRVWLCPKCWLVQLEEGPDPQRIFSNYSYCSSYSDTWLQHAKKFCQEAIGRFHLDETSQVIEVGSNDGGILKEFQKARIPVLGIDPAENLVKDAVSQGVPTRCAFFNSSLAKELAESGFQADLIVGNNVLAHVPDLGDFLLGLKLLLKEEGVVSLEVPHLARLMDECQFDTIYHEHRYYFSLKALYNIFSYQKLNIIDVEELETHGGSLRILVGHFKKNNPSNPPAVKQIIDREQNQGLTNTSVYQGFSNRICQIRDEIQAFFHRSKKEGKTVAGYGAPAKGNTLLNYCGIDSRDMEYTVDRNPLKQGRYLPGTRIPIYSPDKIEQSRPDYLFILPWNLKVEIMEQMKFITEWKGAFVIPLPQLEILKP